MCSAASTRPRTTSGGPDGDRRAPHSARGPRCAARHHRGGRARRDRPRAHGATVHPRPRGGRAGERHRRVLSHLARHRRLVRDGRAPRGPHGARPRSGRRSDHDAVQLHRDRRLHRASRRARGVRRHRPGLLRHRSCGRSGGVHRPYESGVAGAPLRTNGRHDASPGAFATAGHCGGGGRGAGDWRGARWGPERAERNLGHAQLLPVQEPRCGRGRGNGANQRRSSGSPRPAPSEPWASAEVLQRSARRQLPPGRAPGRHPPRQAPVPGRMDRRATEQRVPLPEDVRGARRRPRGRGARRGDRPRAAAGSHRRPARLASVRRPLDPAGRPPRPPDRSWHRERDLLPAAAAPPDLLRELGLWAWRFPGERTRGARDAGHPHLSGAHRTTASAGGRDDRRARQVRVSDHDPPRSFAQEAREGLAARRRSRS